MKVVMGWILFLTGLFLLAYLVMSWINSGVEFTNKCQAHGGTVSRDWKCVQEVKL